MATSTLNLQDFAAKLRAKYPGSYDHLSDTQLVGKVITKYPEYKDKITGMAETQFEKDRTPNSDSGVWSGITSAAKRLAPTSLKDAMMTGVKMMTPGLAGQEAAQEGLRRAVRPMPPGSGVGYRAANLASSLIPGLDPESMERRADRGDTGGILGEAAASTAVAASPLIGEGGGRLASAGRQRLAQAMYTPEGALTPEAKLALNVKKWPEYAARKIAGPPNVPPTYPGATLPSSGEFYEQRAQDLTRRGRELSILDRQAAKEQNESQGYTPSVTRAPIRPEPPSPFTAESVPGPDTPGKGNLLTPAARRGDPRAGQELMRRGRQVLYVPPEEYPAPRERMSLAEIIRQLGEE
jgi:hypothetical protein